LTGLYPHQNGQIGLATLSFGMFRDFPSIPNLLSKAGYRTGIIGKLHVNPESSFTFDYSWNDSRYNSFSHRDVAKVADVAENFMRDSEDPFFLSVNFPDAHLPFLKQENGVPDKPFTAGDVNVPEFVGVNTLRLREQAADYYNCMRRLDTGIGMLLDRLDRNGLKQDTLVIYISDHGAQFSRGKYTCYEGGVRIPFIVRWPGHAEEGIIREELISTVDILPTLLSAANVEVSKRLPGSPLQPLLNNTEAHEWRSYVVTERFAGVELMYFPQYSIRDKRFKIIYSPMHRRLNDVAFYYQKLDSGTHADEIAMATKQVRKAYDTWLRNPWVNAHPWTTEPRIELYDLQDDPNEFSDLSDENKYEDIKIRLFNELQKWRKETNDPLLNQENFMKLTKEIDSVNRQYQVGIHTPYEITRNPMFQWKYRDYLTPNDL
jgi:N-sulfoglucosamine sulfohydrolase